MKNLFIIALLIITIYQNFTVTQLKKYRKTILIYKYVLRRAYYNEQKSGKHDKRGHF